MARYVLKEHPELEDKTIVTIVESGMRKVFEPELTYTVAVYQLNEEEFAKEQAEDPALTLETLQGLSKSKAKKQASLESLGIATIVVDKKTNEFISYEDNLEK